MGRRENFLSNVILNGIGRLDENDLDDESDKKSKLVQLPVRVDMISAGASHSVAANSALGVCF